MKKRSHAVLAVTAGLMTSLCFLAPQAFADGGFASVSEPAVEASSVSTVAKPQVDAASANESGTPVASSAESAATAPSSAPVAASASAGARNGASVAKIGDATYASLDEALAVANTGDTIVLQQDGVIVTTNTISKAVTIKGNGKHSVEVKSQSGTDDGRLNISGSGSLTFDNTKVSFGNPRNWSVVMSDAGKLSFVNGSSATFMQHGIYTVGSGVEINVDKSNLTFSGTSYTPLMNEYRNGKGYAKINVTNGGNLMVEKSAINGATGFVIDVMNSELHIDNNVKQGLVGCITKLDASKATISGNIYGITGYAGLNNLTLTNGSELEMANNKSAGIFLWGGNVDVQDGTKLRITGTGAEGVKQRAGYTGAIACARSAANVNFSDGASVSLVDNPAGAINSDGTIYVGKGTEVLRNGSAAEVGGGIWNRGTVTVADGAKLYNNHAATVGDDIYSTGVVDFKATGSDWRLDDNLGNCGHAIDGWYDDAEGTRWSAHDDAKHVDAVEAGKLEGALALKAAHGLACVDYEYVGEAPSDAVLPSTDVDLEFGCAYTAKAQAAVAGWTFDGWYADEACTVKWTDGAELPGSMTLYGKWTKNPETPATPADTQTPTTTKPASKAKKGIPQTGDQSFAAVPALLAGGAAAIALGVKARRREK